MLTGFWLFIVIFLGVCAGLGKIYEGYYLMKLSRYIYKKEQGSEKLNSNVVSYTTLDDKDAGIYMATIIDPNTPDAEGIKI